MAYAYSIFRIHLQKVSCTHVCQVICIFSNLNLVVMTSRNFQNHFSGKKWAKGAKLYLKLIVKGPRFVL